jgi:tousled-like kinase
VYRNEQECRFYGVWPIIGGRYQTVNLIGKGGFGEVYLAFDLEELEEVAIKVHTFKESFLSIRSQQDHSIKHAMREYETQEKLDHPHIVRLKQVFELDALSFCMVLEYCPGRDLKNELRTRGAFLENQVKTIMRQLFAALVYIHSQDPKVIHFDLKPANILFKDGLIKVADFGLCKMMRSELKSMELTSFGCGTYYYLPPECFGESRSHMINEKVDVWSAGVICYELLYDLKPFGHGKKQE